MCLTYLHCQTIMALPLSSEEGTTETVLTTFVLKMAQAKARIWPWLAYVFQVGSTAALTPRPPPFQDGSGEIDFPEFCTLIGTPRYLNPTPETLNSIDPKPQTLNPGPQTLNPKPQTPNPQP